MLFDVMYDNEIKNIILYMLKNPGVLLKKTPFLYCKISKKVCDKFYRFKKNYPRYLEKDYFKKRNTIKKKLFTEPHWDLLSFNKASNPDTIELAGMIFPLKNTIQWKYKFEDDEDFLALHRWNWIIKELTNNRDIETLAEWGKYNIYDWIDKYIDSPKESLMWEPYTTGERICNLLVFLEVTGIECDEYLKKALTIMAFHVLNNVEYYGEKNTFNHIVNNARALYFYGKFFKKKIFNKAAKEILKNELNGLITKDGFLREGSSHYQFLFTRWILEILYVAKKFDDKDMVSLLTPHAFNLINRCSFFLIFNENQKEWNIPLIGDVSPDFPPEWLMALPRSHLAISLFNSKNETNSSQVKGWSNLFKPNEKKMESVSSISSQVEKPIQAHNNSGWYRFNYENSTLFLHVEPNGIPEYNGHFHNDLCSFCLYRNGSPLLIDIGRLRYSNDDLGRYGLSARGHNCVQIDGLNPYPDKRYLGMWRGICGRPSVSWEKTNNSLEVKIEHSGFKRIFNDKINHVRKFYIFSTYMVIEDSFDGNNTHLVEAFFHFSDKFRIKRLNNDNTQIEVVGGDETYILDCDLSSNTILETITADLTYPAGWRFPKYGVKVPIWTAIYKSKITFPNTHRYIIRWD